VALVVPAAGIVGIFGALAARQGGVGFEAALASRSSDEFDRGLTAPAIHTQLLKRSRDSEKFREHHDIEFS